jgi:1A family penicillin-binding protein
MAVFEKILYYFFLFIFIITDGARSAWQTVVKSKDLVALPQIRKKKIKKSKTLYTSHSFLEVHKLLNSIIVILMSSLSKVASVVKLIGVITQNTVFFLPNSYKKRSKSIKKRGRPSKNKTQVYKPSLLYKMKFFVLGIIMSTLFIFVPLLAIIFISELPDPTNLSMSYVPKTTKIYDRNDVLLYEIYANQNRTVVSLNTIPLYLKQATIAIEDKDFYEHPGFDLRGIMRALVSNISNEYLQGGSTITQQLIKSAFLTPEPTLKRKAKEVVLALWAEKKYTKDQILEMYFNFVPYGGTAWGVESASEIYFGKKVSDLTLSESAFLAGLPRAPSIYSPFSGEGNSWKNRQKDVLTAMVRDKYITQAQANEAFIEELEFISPQIPIKAPHFVMYVKDLLVQQYGITEVERGGLQVKTSLDYTLQEKVEAQVAEHVEKNAYLNVQNGASVVTDPKTGDILAMVGSKNYFDTQNDGNVNVSTSLRQPGSTIKIVTYALALENGFTEATLIDDSPLTILSSDGGPSYSPVNYDGQNHGRPTLRNAFANSYNITAVRVAQKLGVDKILNYGKQLGISTWTDPNRYGLSITLGGGETKMTDLATVFGTVANDGKRVDLNPILTVTDAYGNSVYKKQIQEDNVMSEGTAFIISDILADNTARSAAFGTSSPLHIPGKRVSVKTGTTDNKRDNWTVGFTDEYVVATWVGNNDNTPMSPELTSGVSGAAPMWNNIMTNLLQNTDQNPVNIPPTVVARNCYGKTTYFIRGTEDSINCRFSPNRDQQGG